MGSCKPKQAPGVYPVDQKNVVVVDPITRIEGHLRIEAEIKDGKIVNAWSGSELFRGLELILKGRDPRDAQHFTQRACGVCTYVHALASVRCVEDAVKVVIPNNARLVRNLVMAAQYMHDHVVHFYALHALDFVDVVSALSADPKATADLNNSLPNKRKYSADDYKAVAAKLKAFVDSGQLGPFTNAYFLPTKHPAYKLPPEANLMAVKDYLDSLHLQVKAARAMAVFGAKNPHTQFTVVGGVTCYDSLKPERLNEFRALVTETKKFIEEVYIPDVLAVAPFYLTEATYGGCTNFMSMGEFPQKNALDLYEQDRWFPPGIIMNRDIGNVQPLDPKQIVEGVAHSWYKGNDAKHPYDGVTEPEYTSLEDYNRYSWMKSPRYQGQAMETGPLAHVLVAYGLGQKECVDAVTYVLDTLKQKPPVLFSTLGRTAGRAIEALVTAQKTLGWVDELEASVKSGDDQLYQEWKMPDKAQGVGFVGAPRGGLSHWINIEGGKIGNYQLVVPSTWNLGPRCAAGILGPTEEALVGSPIADSERPVEILRTVHAFDPCIACGVHVIDKDTGKEMDFKVIP